MHQLIVLHHDVDQFGTNLYINASDGDEQASIVCTELLVDKLLT